MDLQRPGARPDDPRHRRRPVTQHIHKGLYGVFIVDPKDGRPPARELVMTMNGFDTNFDEDNEIYAVNTVGFYYNDHPIRVRSFRRSYLPWNKTGDLRGAFGA